MTEETKRPEEEGLEPAEDSEAPESSASADSADGESTSENGKNEPGPEREMSLVDHLDELRSRLTRSFIGVIIGFLGCYYFAEDLYGILTVPLIKALPEGTHLIFTALPEAFFTYLKVSLVAAIFVTSPYTFYQIWTFIAPGLYKEERKLLFPLAFLSALFFCAGAFFCYSQVFDIAFKFFASFSTEDMVITPKVSEYLSFALKFLFAFGLVFEMPLFVFFLARMGVVTATMMRGVRMYAILGMFIVSAILTPPDVASQLLMVGPLLILYEISIIVAALFGRKKKTEDEEDEDDESSDKDDTAEQPSS